MNPCKKKINYSEMMKYFMSEPKVEPKSNMYLKVRTCGLKKSYLTKEEAQVVSNRMEYQKNESFHVYKCPYCKLFHVGHLRKNYV